MQVMISNDAGDSSREARLLAPELPVCPACHCKYIVKGNVFRPKTLGLTSPPLLLQCGHTMCSSCVKAAIRLQKMVACPKCKAVTRVTRTNQLPPNMYLFGLIADHSFHAYRPKSCININLKMVPSSTLKHARRQQSSLSTAICGNCRYSAHLMCCNCNSPFCGPCFKKIHKRGDFSHHTSKSLNCYRTKSTPLHTCKVLGHEDKMLAYFCTTDDESLCADCLVSNHKGHDVIKLSEKLKVSKDEFRETLETLKTTAKCLKYSEKAIVDLIEEGNVTDKKCIAEIRSTFQDLHGTLQLRESLLISQVKDNEDARDEAMRTALKHVEENQQQLDLLISDVEQCLDADGCKCCDVGNLMNKLDNLSKLPCYLAPCDINNFTSRLSSATVDWESVGSVVVDYNSEVVKLIPYGEVDDAMLQVLLENDSMEGVPELELPPDLELLVSKCEDSIDSTVESSSLVSYSSDFTNGTEYCDVAVRGRKLINRKNRKAGKKIAKRSKESKVSQLTSQTLNLDAARVEVVRVIHVVSPVDFYVQRKTDYAALDEMCRSLDCLLVTDLTKACEVRDDQIYLVKFEEREWRRTRVKSSRKDHVNENSDETMPRTLYDVFYIDFGISEELRSACFYNMPAQYFVNNTFTIRCSLYGIEPVDKTGGWSHKATEEFKKCAHMREVNMTIIAGDDRDGVWLVDIGRVKQCSNMSSATPLSLRTSLVFLNLACYSCPENEHPNISADVNLLQCNVAFKDSCSFYAPCLPLAGETFAAQVSYVQSPTNFYVQRMGEFQKPLEKLITDMQSHYVSFKPGSVFCDPISGMGCVVKYTDGNFYRAKVIGILEMHKFNVYYVDFGNTDEVDYVNILPIFPKFTKLPELAIHCSLADVSTPGGIANWPDKSSNYIRSAVDGKYLNVHVEAKSDDRLVVSVSLVEDSFNVNLNSGLVCEGLASSSGPCSRQMYVNRERLSKSIGNMSSIPSWDCEMSLPRNEKGEPLFRAKVVVTSIESPASIYVQMFKDKKRIFELKNELQRKYDNNLPLVNVEWKVGTMCVMQSPSDKRWYRAIINDVIEEDGCVFKVFLIDYGKLFAVSAEMLRVIEGSHSLLGAFAYHCHLYGITAPGGSSRWPSVTTEFLIEELKRFDNISYLAHVDDTTEENVNVSKRSGQPSTFPIDLIVKDVQVKGALEPMTIEYKSVTDKLLDMGLAIPNKPCRQRLSIPRLKTDDVYKEEDEARSASVNFFHNFEQHAADDSFDSINLNSGSDGFSDISIQRNVVSPAHSNQLIADIEHWLPAHVPRQAGYRFQAVPTYIGDDGLVFMHDANEDCQPGHRLNLFIFDEFRLGAPLLKIFEESLAIKYEGSESQTSDYYWYPGQPCIAQYTDGNWYRGCVVSVEFSVDEAYTVEFIDYGNTANLKVGQVRKECCLLEYPRLAFACRLFNIEPISPDGKFSNKLLNFLQKKITDRVLWVTIQDPGTEGVPPAVDIEMLDGISLNDLLVNLKFARHVGELAISPVSDNSSRRFESTRKPDYSDDITMTVGASKLVQITDVVSPTIICVRIISKDSQWKVTKKNYRKIMASAKDWAPVEAEIGLPCCAKCTSRNLWCRATIQDVDVEHQTCTVFYVDFGIQESLPLDKLRELPVELLLQPKQAFFCELFQLEPVDGVCANTLTEKLRSLLSTQQKWFIEVKECGNPVAVDLRVEEAGNMGELAYQALVDNDDMKLVRKCRREEML